MTISRLAPIPPADMLLFVAVAGAGGFTHAARKLGLSKQTISERIARLEQVLGVRLFERTTRRLRLTDLGATYLERCAAIAAQIDEANSEVQRRQSEPVGLLRVSAPVLYGRSFLAPVVADYLGRYPRVRVEVLLADRHVHLIEEGIDLAIRIGELKDSSLQAQKLGEGHVYLVASPRYLAAHPVVDAASLQAARCIGHRAQETWSVRGQPVRVDPVLVVNDHEVACAAAIAGVGVARLPGLACRAAVADGRLQVLFSPEHALARPVYVVFPGGQHRPARVRVFVEALTALVEPMQPLELPAARGRGARPGRRAGR